MNKIVLFLAIPCVIAIALSAMEVEGFVYGMQTPMFGAQQQAYRSQQLLAIAQRNRLNNLARVSEFSKFVNYSKWFSHAVLNIDS